LSKVGTLDNTEIAQNVQIVMNVLDGISKEVLLKSTYPGGLPRDIAYEFFLKSRM